MSSHHCGHGYFLGQGCPDGCDRLFCAHGVSVKEACADCRAAAEHWHEEAAPTPSAEDVLADPAVHYWVKDALRVALTKDPVDAANGAALLAAVLRCRCDGILEASITGE